MTMLTPTERAAERGRLVADAVADIRALASGEVDRAVLDQIRARLLGLAEHGELFGADDFPPPQGDGARGSCLYRVSQDADDTFALYVNSCADRTDTPAHNHTTWAVVVGLEGEELNRFYRRTAGGVEEIGRDTVRLGAGIAMLPDDLHSIHIRGGGRFFHMYGLALERLDQRVYFWSADGTWKVFEAHPDIREARAALTSC
ncbi:MAG: cysteine dioxygenase [Acidimicrobiia bacterium]|nr:cysteine dioxygenase [Acidimicrobiia bacterium]